MLHRLKREGKFGILFVIGILSIMIPSLIANRELFQIVFMVMFSVMVISGATAISITPKHRRRAQLFAVITLLLSWLFYADISMPIPHRLENVPFLAFFLYIVYYLIVSILKSREVTLDVIFGAVSGYIYLGYTGAIYFLTIHDIYPHSFGDSLDEPMNAVYFSFVTISTLGYGDITPVSNAAKGGSIILTILGQFYLAVVVAMLVSKYLVRSHK